MLPPYLVIYGSAEQKYTGYVVIPQYCLLIPSNVMNTVIPQSTDIIKYSSLMFFNLFSAKIRLAYLSEHLN